MKGSLVIGEVRGIKIEVNISWLIIFGLITFTLATTFFPQNYPDWDPSLGWILGAFMAIMLFGSVLLHELAHSLVAINLGIGVKRITLFIFGGIAQMEGEPDEPLKELKIAIAGPFMSIFLFGVFSVLAGIFDYLGFSEVVLVPLTYLATINLILALFNMVPAFPLDGGRVLRSLIWYYNGSLEVATKIASTLGGMFGYFLIFLGLFGAFSGNIVSGIWYIFIGWFINQASQSSYKQTVMSDIFNKIPVKKFMSDKVVVVDYSISVQELVDNYFYNYKFATFPVSKHGEIIGIVNLDNVKDIPKDTWSQTPVAAINVPLEENLIISSDNTVTSAIDKLFTNKVGRVLIMDEGKLLGIVSKTDVLNYIRIHSQLR